MRVYAVALACGVLVGVIYGLLNVRSPAPPVVALIGLLGMLVGEQVVPMVKRLMVGEPITVGWIKSDCVPHIFGELPTKSASIDAIDHEVRNERRSNSKERTLHDPGSLKPERQRGRDQGGKIHGRRTR